MRSLVRPMASFATRCGRRSRVTTIPVALARARRNSVVVRLTGTILCEGVRALVVDRVALAAGSKECVSPDIDAAWTEWEGHFFDTLFPSPWQEWGSFPRGVLQAEAPPPPLP
jgi:hypothetical protein